MPRAPEQIRSLARAHGRKAIEVLHGIMMEPKSPEASRIKAAELLLERGYGKVPQALTGADGDALPAFALVFAPAGQQLPGDDAKVINGHAEDEGAEPNPEQVAGIKFTNGHDGET